MGGGVKNFQHHESLSLYEQDGLGEHNVAHTTLVMLYQHYQNKCVYPSERISSVGNAVRVILVII